MKVKIQTIPSKRVQASGFSRVNLLIRRRLGSRVIDLRAKTEIEINAERYDAAKNVVLLYSEKAIKSEYVKKRHNNAATRLKELCIYIEKSLSDEPDEAISSKWLQGVVNAFEGEKKRMQSNIYDHMRKWAESKREGNGRQCLLMTRYIYRWDCYNAATNGNWQGVSIDRFNYDLLSDFREYLANEGNLYKEKSDVFMKLEYPDWLRPAKRVKLRNKGENMINTTVCQLRNFFSFAVEEKLVGNNPFHILTSAERQDVIRASKFADPYYLTKEERDAIASLPVSKQVEVYRDAFVLQCLIGCRFSDLSTLKHDNIRVKNGVTLLVYFPKKTERHETKATVPLLPKALEIIEKYKGTAGGYLLPELRKCTYNRHIKQMCKDAGITRTVEVIDQITHEIKRVPLHTVASSHMARRTFIGVMYKAGHSPEKIGKMSGHVKNSRAIARYYEIDEEMLADTIQSLI